MSDSQESTSTRDETNNQRLPPKKKQVKKSSPLIHTERNMEGNNPIMTTTLRADAQSFVPPSSASSAPLMVPSSVAVKGTRSRRPPRKIPSSVQGDAVEQPLKGGITSSNTMKKNRPRKAKTNHVKNTTPNDSADSSNATEGLQSIGVSKSQPKNCVKNKTSKKSNSTERALTTSTVHAITDEDEDEGEMCLLCTNTITCAAVGRCNHPICHICSLRMRVKTGDRCCPVCKEDSEVVVVFPFPVVSPSGSPSPLLSEISFESFHLDSDALESPLPGVEVLHKARMLFVDAHKHFVHASELLSLSCPVCLVQFRSEKNLHQHVKDRHQRQFCHLCFSHRPLFTSEMRLMTSSQLKEHMRATVTSADSDGQNKGQSRRGSKQHSNREEVAAGHQLCRFCSTYFYDTQDLYVHMRDDHFTCHLCPPALSHRFYRHLPDFLQHLSSTHFLCSLCLNSHMTAASSSGSALSEHGAGVVAFKRQGEYAEHMLSAHNIKSASSSYSSLSAHIAASFSVKSSSSSSSSSTPAAPSHLDLQFSSSDPYNLSDESPTAPPVNHRPTQHGRRGHRITPEGESGGMTDRSSPPPPPLASSQYPALYPSLPSEPPQHISNSQTTAIATTPTTAPHPLSLTHKLAERRRAAAALKEEEARKKDIQKAFENRRELRNTAFADALGLGNRSLMQTVRSTATASSSSSGGGCGHGGLHMDGAFCPDPPTEDTTTVEIEQHVLNSLAKVPLFFELFRPENPLGLVHVPKALSTSSSARADRLLQVLRKPLYSTDLIAWAKNHRVDLVKVEKKIQEMINDENATSCQLKPMKKWSLESVHLLAKYYGLNSQQFKSANFSGRGGGGCRGEEEAPSQYLSLVRTADSCAPALLLSAATLPHTHQSTGSSNEAPPQQVELQELMSVRENLEKNGILKPTLYFMINTKRQGAGTTVGDFICQIKSLVESTKKPHTAPSMHPEDRIIELLCIGNGLIRVSLNSFSAAHRLLLVSTSCDGTPSAPSQWETTDLPSKSLLDVPLSEKFYISGHFSEEDIEFADFIDDQLEKDFSKSLKEKEDCPPTNEDYSRCPHDGKEVEMGSGESGREGGSEVRDWDSYTPEDMEKLSLSLEQRQATLQQQQKQLQQKQLQLQQEEHNLYPLSSNGRPDLPPAALRTLSVFSRDRLPARVASSIDPPPLEDLPPGFTAMSKTKLDTKSSSNNGSKISVHKSSSCTGPCSGEVLSSEEDHDLRLAIEESLRDAQLHEFQKEYKHLDIAPRSTPSTFQPAHLCSEGSSDHGVMDSSFGSRRPGVYQAPRGPSVTDSPLPSDLTATKDSLSQLPGLSSEAESTPSREPIVIPQQLRQAITYPVRYTQDRRNHRQQVQNSFSVLQNGEIDTYYHSEEDDEEEEEGDGDAEGNDHHQQELQAAREGVV